MPRETTYAGVLGQLTRFVASLAANAAELGHLDGPRARLTQLVTEAQEVARQQAALAASKQEATRRLVTLLVESQRAATGIQKLLQEFYGLRSEKLAEFNLQPFRGRRRSAESETPSPSPSPPDPEPTTPEDPKP
jgi:hypothetical protein